ncbi:MAG: hypothetical protein U0075_19690 [Thermomicrobiales bacterium]|jgi:uncharacterized protein HemX
MLAYTAVDSLRVISRDFDFDWQPAVNDDLAVARRSWSGQLRTRQRLNRIALAVLALLLPASALAGMR